MAELVILRGAQEKLARLRAKARTRHAPPAAERAAFVVVTSRPIGPPPTTSAGPLGAAVTATLLLDNSAWIRLGDTGLPAERRRAELALAESVEFVEKDHSRRRRGMTRLSG